MKWIISNHKEGLIDDDYKNEINNILNQNIKLIICPNDIQLASFKNNNYLLGSQDVDYNFNLEELKSMSVKYTILGHSDKRKKYHETNIEINEKMKKLIEFDICPILCIGEEKEIETDIEEILSTELEQCLKNIKTDNIIIAYEPVWAIGSGKIPNIEMLIEIIEYIKIKTKELIGIIPTVVYGGSVNENTIKDLEMIDSLDGYLIGSASLDIKKLKELIGVIK